MDFPYKLKKTAKAVFLLCFLWYAELNLYSIGIHCPR